MGNKDGEEEERSVYQRLNKARMIRREGTSVNDMFSVFKDVVTAVAPKMVGYRVPKGRKEGDARWKGEIKKATEERRAHKKMLQI